MIKRLFKLLKKYIILIVTALLMSGVSVGLQLYVPFLTGKAIDLMDDSNINFKELYIIIGMMFLCVLLAFIFMLFVSNLLNYVAYKLIAGLREDAFNKIHLLPVSYIDSHSHGNIVAIITNDIDVVSDGLLQTFQSLLNGIITIIITIIFMLVYEYKIALMVIFLTPLSMISATVISKLTFKTFKKQAKIKGDLSSFLEESFSNLTKNDVYDYQDAIIEKFDVINNELDKVGFKAQFSASFTNPITRFINSIIYASVGIYGAYLCITQNYLTAGIITSFLTYANQYTKPFNEISNVIQELQNAFSSARRIFAFLDEREIDIDNMANLEEISDISFKNISFSYVKDKVILDDFNLTIKKNTKVALVGKTGCGKSTVINLLMRFYDYDNGEIIINSDIKHYSKKSLRDKIGMGLQDNFIFKASVYENLCYGKKSSLDDVQKACKKAFAHDFIMRLPQGYDTIIDNNSLSSGEKQLLCIARMILMDKEVLILDEATSNIDTRLEVLINNALMNLMKDKTCIIIAHRLKTIQDADLIAVVANKKVVELGTHEFLISQNGEYKQIFEAQFSN